MAWYVGLDLGQASDYTALSITECTEERAYHVRHLQRYKLGTSYPDIVASVNKVIAAQPLNGEAILIVDQTGVGRPVMDMLAASGLTPIGITITGANAHSSDGRGGYQVPKRDLVSALSVLLQNKRLKFADGLPEAATLVQEMMAFRVKITTAAHDVYGSWREGSHDDLVLSLAMACWYAEAIGHIQIWI